MRRRDAWLVRLLMFLYPRRFRRERGAELERSYEDLLAEHEPGDRGWIRLALWLLADAAATGVRARLSGSASRKGRAPETDGRGDGMMTWTAKYLGQAMRSLARSPGFALVAILTLGLGVGLNSAIFGVVHTVLLRPLPYHDADELVRLTNRYLPAGGTGWVSGAEYWEYRKESRALAAAVPVTTDAANLTGLPAPLRVEGLMAGPGLFELLGAPPALGRGFLPEEGRPGGEPVVVLGHALWRTAFGADPGILNRTVELGGRSRKIVGVMGPDYEPVSGYLFTGRPEEYLVPLVVDPATFDRRSVERHNLLVLGRLAEGVDPGQAETRLTESVRRLERLYPGISNEGSRDVAVDSLHEAAVGPVRGTLLLLAAAAGLVLLVACVNVANLMVARADTRTAEIAIRAAMGAGRARLVWHGLAESLVIGAAGGVVGLALALAVRETLPALVPAGTPIPQGVAVGLPLVGFTIGLALLSGALAGMLPALHIGRGDVFGAIKSGGGDEPAGRAAVLRKMLVVAQVAGAVVLISSASLLLRSLTSLRAVDAGFEAEGLYGVHISASGEAYPGATEVRELYRTIETRVAEIARVEVAAASWQTPLQSGMSDWPVMPRRDGETEWYSADPNLVGVDFFRAYGIEVLEGRAFEPVDAERMPGPVILNRTGARRLFGEGRAVGQYVNLTFGDPVWREVIGVVEDVRARGLAEEPRVQSYMTFGEGPFASIPSLVLNVRGALGGEELRRAVTGVVHAVDPDIPVGAARSMEGVVADSIGRERLLSVLLGVFATIALVLGAIGVYGLVSYAVGRRTREIGLRIAIGAHPGAVLEMVVRQGVLLGSLGVALGLAGSLAAGRVLEGFLFGVSRSDPLTLAAVALGMLAVTGLASLLPARRAAGVDPLEALRE